MINFQWPIILADANKRSNLEPLGGSSHPHTPCFKEFSEWHTFFHVLLAWGGSHDGNLYKNGYINIWHTLLSSARPDYLPWHFSSTFANPRSTAHLPRSRKIQLCSRQSRGVSRCKPLFMSACEWTVNPKYRMSLCTIWFAWLRIPADFQV